MIKKSKFPDVKIGVRILVRLRDGREFYKALPGTAAQSRTCGTKDEIKNKKLSKERQPGTTDG